MPPVGHAKQFLKLGPVRIATNGVMICHDPSTLRDPIQQALPQQLFDCILVGAVRFEFLHVLFGWPYPLAVAVVHNNDIEFFKILRQVHRHVVADNRLKCAGLLTE